MGKNDLITLTEAARRLGRSRELISRWVKQGRIPATYVAGRPYIKSGDCKLPKFLPPGPKPQE